ncbi:MAG: hypothetical protein HHJ12_02035 [Glaciimonas sp.]|nr:hypothetical protein [Glaciimonas sp.]
MSTIFSKTEQGQEEIKTRSGSLTQHVRQVLIFVNGKRDMDALRKMLPTDDLESTLQMLQEQGYIEAVEMTEIHDSEPVSISPLVPVEKTSMPTGSIFRDLPLTPSTKELELARNFMMNTLKSFTGPYATISLIEKVEAAQSHTEMRAQFNHWIDAIIQTHPGKQRADELRSALLKII